MAKQIGNLKLVNMTHSLKGTCYHEAAHAAMYYYFGFGSPIRGIEIYSDAEAEVFANPYVVDKDTYYAAIVTALAGYAAEFKINKKSLPIGCTGPDDYTSARGYLNLISGEKSDDFFDGVMLFLYEQDTRRLIRKKNIWAGIEALANVLLTNKSLDGETVEAILSKHIIRNQYEIPTATTSTETTVIKKS